jgi:hypothetical protein
MFGRAASGDHVDDRRSQALADWARQALSKRVRFRQIRFIASLLPWLVPDAARDATCAFVGLFPTASGAAIDSGRNESAAVRAHTRRRAVYYRYDSIGK